MARYPLFKRGIGAVAGDAQELIKGDSGKNGYMKVFKVRIGIGYMYR